MERDIDRVIEQVRKRLPNVEVIQLGRVHRADDDGLWFFRLPEVSIDIQLESSTGSCPFIVEHDHMKSSSEACKASSINEAVDSVVAYLEEQST